MIENTQKSFTRKEIIIPATLDLPLELQFLSATFLHGSSSSVFAFLKPLGINHLIPTGILRKKYQCHPLSGELGMGTIGLHGRRKGGINYQYLSGFACSSHLDGAISYSRDFSHFNKEHVAHSFSRDELSAIKDLPLETDCPITRRIILKKLQIKLQNLMLMDPNWEDNKLEMGLKLEKTLAENHHSPLTVKYLAEMLETIRLNRLPFIPDDRFRELIQNQFPIVWVSTTLTPIPYGKGIPGEHLIKGKIDLTKDIQQVITPIEHVEQLRALLDEYGFNHIKIFAYKVMEVEVEKTSSYDEYLTNSHINNTESQDISDTPAVDAVHLSESGQSASSSFGQIKFFSTPASTLYDSKDLWNEKYFDNSLS